MQQSVKPPGLHYSKGSTIYLLLKSHIPDHQPSEWSEHSLFSSPLFCLYNSLLNIDIDVDTDVEAKVAIDK